MAHKQIYLSKKKQKWADQFKPEEITGKALRPSASTAQAFESPLGALVDQMIKESRREILSLFTSDVYDHGHDLAARIMQEEGLRPILRSVPVMDASIAVGARVLMNRLSARFKLLFDDAASEMTQKMVERTLSNSTTGLKGSLRDIAGNVTLKTDIFTAELRDVVSASISEAVGLIKRIPEKYLGQVQGDVMRSITTGQGLADLQPALEKQGATIKNWAKNTALDQTRKVYNSINKGRMQAVGIKKFQWIHSGGSNNPRELHIRKAENGGLNGRICSFDDLPIIDDKTGEKGIPGQLPHCHCVMKPVFSFDDDDE